MTIPHRKPLRLKEFDYTQPGGYFVTLAAYKHTSLFGEIQNGEMILSPIGRVVEEMLAAIPGRFTGVGLDEFIIMPDHIHMILLFEEIGGIVPPLLGKVVRAFKAAVSYRCSRMHGQAMWQRNYYEHIIRDERDLRACREYVVNNVQAWMEKRNPE